VRDGVAKPRVLLVEDDRELAGMLAELLADVGYETEVAHDGQRGLHLGLTGHYDVMIIDRRLPVLDGLELLRRLRARAVTTRVLVLSALGEVADRVAGLDAGADDYLVKPFATDELLARVRALLRRGKPRDELLAFGELTFEVSTRAVRVGGELLGLSGREADVLELLMRNARRVVTREQAIATIWGGAATANVVDRYVSNLRRKLADVAQIDTVRGVGFVLR